jgi:hypothetical protein
MSVEKAEAALLEAQANQAPLDEQLKLRAALDKELREEEVAKQAIYFDISEDAARSRIELNAEERAHDQPRTIWDDPNQGEK